MKRAVLTVIALFALAGCGSKNPPSVTQPTTPGPSVEASATPSAEPTSTAQPIHFTVDGAGPYQIGATLAALQGAGLLDEVNTGAETCPQNTTARGKGVWKDIRMSFRPDGKLYIAINRSTDIPTPSGAYLGNTLAAVSSIYGSIGQELMGGKAYIVVTGSGRGILFDLDTSKKVFAMVAGDAVYLKNSYEGGTDFC